MREKKHDPALGAPKRADDLSIDSGAATAASAPALLKEFPESKREAIKRAIAEANKGVFISSEAMNRWVDSWGEENELPPPNADVRLKRR